MKKRYIAPANKDVRFYTKSGMLDAGIGVVSDTFEGGGNAKDRVIGTESSGFNVERQEPTGFGSDAGPWESLW